MVATRARAKAARARIRAARETAAAAGSATAAARAKPATTTAAAAARSSDESPRACLRSLGCSDSPYCTGCGDAGRDCRAARADARVAVRMRARRLLRRARADETRAARALTCDARGGGAG